MLRLRLQRRSCAPLAIALGFCLSPGAAAQQQFVEWPGRFPIDRNDSEGAALADVDGDGDLDAVFGNYAEINTLYRNDGTGVFTDVTATHMPFGAFTFTMDLVVRDVDGDRDVDIVIANGGTFTPRQNELYLNDGTGKFSDFSGRLPRDFDFTGAVALGDVDGDDDLDIVFGNRFTFGTRRNKLHLNDGRGFFTDVTAARTPVEANETYDVELVDVDGDRDKDLVVANASPRPRNRLYFNDGRGFFTNVTEARMPIDADDSQCLALGDVDGDSDLDLVFGNDLQQDRLYLNDGTGRFTDATGRLPADSDWTATVLLGDVDGDDDPDLVIGNHGPENRLYTNLHRQLFAPAVARLSQTYRLQLHARPGYGSTAHTGAAVLGPGLSEQPLSIPSWGSFYLAPPLFALPPVSLPQPKGVGTVPLAIPGNASLVGTALFFQALIVDASVPEAHFTGYATGVIRP